jgi:hemerythrin
LPAGGTFAARAAPLPDRGPQALAAGLRATRKEPAMSLITWTDSMSVKVHEIDTQHRTLVQLINDLNDAMHKGHGQDVLGRLIAGLANYAVMHFATEERLFKQHGYPGSTAHVAEHHRFVEEVTAFKRGFDDGKHGLSIQVMRFLSDWLRKHIMGTDMKYAEFFVGKGVK